MEIQYRRELNHNYLIIEQDMFDENEYETKMIMKNQIYGFLSMSIRNRNGKTVIYYEISSKQPMRRVFGNREIGYKELWKFLLQFHKMILAAEEYLIDTNHLMIMPEYIYMNLETEEIAMLYSPTHSEDTKEAFQKLAEYILDRVNHQDEKAVFLAYKLYKNTRNDNFIIEEILESGTEQSECKETFVTDIREENESIQQTIRNDFSNGRDNSIYHKEDLEEKDRRESDTVIGVQITEKQNKESGKKLLQKGKYYALIIIGIVVIAGLIYMQQNQLLPVGMAYEKILIALGIAAMLVMGGIIGIYRSNTCNKELEDEEHQEESAFENNIRIAPQEAAAEKSSLNKKKATVQRVFTEQKADRERNEETLHVCRESDLTMQVIKTTNRKTTANTADADKEEREIKIYDFFSTDANEDKRETGSSYKMDRPQEFSGVAEEATYGDTVLLGTISTTEKRILVRKDIGETITYSLDKLPFVVGKMRNCVDLELQEPSISRMHARFFEKDGEVYLEDLNSTNGTFKNGMRLEANETVKVEREDEISFAEMGFVYY